MMGHTNWLVNTLWPEVDQKLLVNQTVTIGVQINGKLRATITLPTSYDQKQTEDAALANDSVQRALEGKSIKKIVVVPGRIVNVVAG
jgi:leucyl-tRNA synthetase